MALITIFFLYILLNINTYLIILLLLLLFFRIGNESQARSFYNNTIHSENIFKVLKNNILRHKQT
jgi:hypothetical protein